jgi:hypothetical protein
VHSVTRSEISSLTFGALGRGLGFRFLLVFPLSMMVQIVEHRVETSVDFLVEEEAASSTPWVPNHLVSGTAIVHAVQQHTTAQTSRTPSRVAPGALSAARELLRHPPSSTASLGAMKQWRDDVDRLLGMAHSGSTRSRPRSSRCQHEATTSVRSPLMRGAQTNDLRAELNRRCAGEDARVSLERARERRQNFEGREDTRVSLERARERRLNIKGRNLDQDFAAVAMQTCWAPGSRRMSLWPVWATPHLRIISAWPPGHPSSDLTCRKSTTVRPTRRNSCRCTSPPLRQQVETPP